MPVHFSTSGYLIEVEEHVTDKIGCANTFFFFCYSDYNYTYIDIVSQNDILTWKPKSERRTFKKDLNTHNTQLKDLSTVEGSQHN
jgi:hypothetical protein